MIRVSSKLTHLFGIGDEMVEPRPFPVRGKEKFILPVFGGK